jgi:hypothetical protein
MHRLCLLLHHHRLLHHQNVLLMKHRVLFHRQLRRLHHVGHRGMLRCTMLHQQGTLLRMHIL